jgi:hypothetical protein
MGAGYPGSMDKAHQIDATAAWLAAGPRDGFRAAGTFLGDMGLVSPGEQALAFGVSVAIFALVLGVMVCRSVRTAGQCDAPVLARVTAKRAAVAGPASRRG